MSENVQENKEPQSTDTAGFTPINSQEELDRIIGNRLAREREKFSDYEASQKILLSTAASVPRLTCTSWTILKGTVHPCFETVFKGAPSWLFSMLNTPTSASSKAATAANNDNHATPQAAPIQPHNER